MTSVTLIFNYRKTNAYACNVLCGAVEASPACAKVEINFAQTPEELVTAAQTALGRNRRVVAAWSFYSPQFAEVFAELAAVKAQLPSEVMQLAGGVHATADAAHTLRGGFDYAAVGEGEKLLTEFLSTLQNGGDVTGVKGIATLRDGKYTPNGQGERIELDDFPACAPRHFKFNPIEITRGCIYACKFCQTPFMFKARFRHRSVKSVCHYAGLMRDNGGFDVRFITPTSLSYGSQDESVNLAAVEELLAAVRETMGPRGRIFFGTFPSEVRPEHVTPEALRMLKKYVNNDNLLIGGQSGSDAILASSRRGHDVSAILSAARIARECGFKPNVDFIFGLPGETPADVDASLQLAEQLSAAGAKVHAHTFMPLPGTPYKNAPAGRLAPETARQLERLASGGQLYGQWKQQQQIAAALEGVHDNGT